MEARSDVAGAPRADRITGTGCRWSQRLAVEAAQRVGRLASPDRAQRFRLDAFRRDTLVAQDRAGRFVGRGRAKQQVLVLTQRFVSIC
jgi:hypothetical protein